MYTCAWGREERNSGVLDSSSRTWKLQTHLGLFSKIQVSFFVDK